MENSTVGENFKQSDGDVFLDDVALCRILDDFDTKKEDASRQYISDLSRVVEALIFYERVFVITHPIDDENDEGYYIGQNPLALLSLIEAFNQAGILHFVEPAPILKMPQPNLLVSQVKQLDLVTEDDLALIDPMNFGSYLYQQEFARIHDVPFVSSDSPIARLFVDRSTALKYSVANSLLGLVNQAATKELELLKERVDVPFIIPPVLAVVLDKVNVGASLGEAVLDAREEFKKLRRLFLESTVQLRDQTVPLGRQIKLSKTLTSDFEKAAASFDLNDRTTISIWSDVLDFVFTLAAELDPLAPLKILDLLPRLKKLSVDSLNLAMNRRRYSSVHKLSSDFYSIKGYAELISKALSGYKRESERLWPNGFICVGPGNPFREI
ncbi:MAG: hypothetical protein KF698_07130 [Anaerolineales bacterium]|nr:hypothetical protein [Anaerolineales bacterium]